MQYKDYKDGIKLSRLGMGNMRLPVIDGDQGKIDEEKALAIIDECYNSGVNYFDTAFNYHNGMSEIFVGKALARYPRDSFYVATKYNYMANPDPVDEFSKQLEKLQMDHVDFYLLHGLRDELIDTMVNIGAIDYFNKQKEEGKIRYFGFSFHGTVDGLKKLLSLNKWDFVQIQLNYYDWYLETAKGQYDVLTEAGIPVVVMEPAHGGMLANLSEPAAAKVKAVQPEGSLASFAMRFVKSLPNVQVVLSGMSELDQVIDNVITFSEGEPFTEAELAAAEDAAKTQKATVTLPCTACHYCCPDCPQQLDIPELLVAYNAFKIGGPFSLMRLASLPAEKQPSACIGCGSCTRHCPQEIDVPAAMKEMAEVMARFKR